MRILIFGKAGQVARSLHDLEWPSSWHLTFLGRDDCDLLRPGVAAEAIGTLKPDLVINAAAYTAVDKAENDKVAAYALNADAPAEMAAATDALGVPLLHISTDYVFEGGGERPYLETDTCAPLSMYGKSKLDGEIRVREANTRHLILRTSWVFSSYGANFVRTMLRLGGERDELSVVGDQWGGPTAAGDIAHALQRIGLAMAKGRTAYGTYHLAGDPFTSWYGFAQAIFERAQAKGAKAPKSLRRITTAEYPTPAVRPANSRLDCAAIGRDWNIEQPSWEIALDRCLDQLLRPANV